jgi:hypothetical protein
VSAERHFFDASNPRVQVMSARADREYAGVGMQRTMFLLRDARLPYPVVLDLYRLTSAAQQTADLTSIGVRTYDYPIHFRGQLITTNARYEAHTTTRRALGTKFGYQHLWNEAQARTDSTVRLTWLDGKRYYTVTTAGAPNTEVIFARTGAADSSFNLIVEPLMLVRRRAADHLFASVIEPHGYFSELEERSADPRGAIESVRVLGSTAEASVVEVMGRGGLRWTVMVTNGPASATARHAVTFGGQRYEWTGNYRVDGVQTPR